MKNKSGILVFVCFLSLAFSADQSEINYQHKTLTKALQKIGLADYSAVEEISLENSIMDASIVNGKYFLINENVREYKYIYIGRVNSCRAGGCSINNSIPAYDSNSEYFDYFILFDANKSVQAVRVFNYQASHGHEITAKGWLKQFAGHNGSEPLLVDKNIDAISGATISVYAITHDIEMKTEILHQLSDGSNPAKI